MARFKNSFEKLSSMFNASVSRKEEIKEAKEAYDEIISQRRNEMFEKPKRVFDPEKDAILITDSYDHYSHFQESTKGSYSILCYKGKYVDIDENSWSQGSDRYRGWGIIYKEQRSEKKHNTITQAKQKLGVKGKVWRIAFTVNTYTGNRDNSNRVSGYIDDAMIQYARKYKMSNISRHSHYNKSLPDNCTDSEYALVLSKEYNCAYSTALAWVRCRAQWKHERTLGECMETINELGEEQIFKIKRFTNRSLPSSLKGFSCPRAGAHIEVCKAILNAEYFDKEEAVKAAQPKVKKLIK